MSQKFGCGVVASAFVVAAALGLSPAVAKDLKLADDKAYAQAPPFPAAPPSREPSLGHFVVPFAGLDVGVVGSSANFDTVAPPFNVGGVSGVAGINGGVLIKPSDGKFRFGPRFGFLTGFGSNSISGPAASPFFDYRVETAWIVYYEAEAEWCPDWGSERMQLTFSLGGATTNRSITATMHSFNFQQMPFTENSSHTSTGLTASVGLGLPITRQIDLTSQLRWLDTPSAPFFVPGLVQVSGYEIIGTLGMRMKFGY
jgi:hypothetical protein